MALSADTRPHFTTIANFISTMDKEVVKLFLEVLLVCDEQGLIGKDMFAIDGCKLPSNASKEWSGTKEEFKRKVQKMEKAIKGIVEKHRMTDKTETGNVVREKEEKYIKTLQDQVKKIREWLKNNEDKIGKSGKPIKSNITDNESAKLKTSKGVIQGYNGVTVVDSKSQVIVAADAFGQGNERELLKPMLEDVEKNFKAIGEDEVLKKAKVTADSGFHSEANLKMLSEKGIDGYIADPYFRKRDPRFQEEGAKYREEKEKRRKRDKQFRARDFSFAEDLSYCICPAGKKLYRSGCNIERKGFRQVRFKAPKSACSDCELRGKCMRDPEKTEARQVAYIVGKTEEKKNSFTEKMKRKIDTGIGRIIYGMRLGIAEPPFAHIRSIMGLDRFTLRTKKKVDIQWKLYSIVHNMKKIHRYGMICV
jgi:hypothetical protein